MKVNQMRCPICKSNMFMDFQGKDIVCHKCESVWEYVGDKE